MKEIAFKKTLVFVNALVPLAMLLWDWQGGRLGADPLNFVTRATGTLTLVFLLLTLAVTPVRQLTGAQSLIKLRRMIGLYAFFYGALHFFTYLWVDKGFKIGEVVADVAQRKFIVIGMVGFFLLIPLAVTSTNGWIKRMGGKRWAKLHKATYVAAIAGVLHYYLLVKADTTKPLLFGAVLVALLGYRLIKHQQRQKPVSLGVADRKI